MQDLINKSKNKTQMFIENSIFERYSNVILHQFHQIVSLEPIYIKVQESRPSPRNVYFKKSQMFEDEQKEFSFRGAGSPNNVYERRRTKNNTSLTNLSKSPRKRKRCSICVTHKSPNRRKSIMKKRSVWEVHDERMSRISCGSSTMGVKPLKKSKKIKKKDSVIMEKSNEELESDSDDGSILESPVKKKFQKIAKKSLLVPMAVNTLSIDRNRKKKNTAKPAFHSLVQKAQADQGLKINLNNVTPTTPFQIHIKKAETKELDKNKLNTSQLKDSEIYKSKFFLNNNANNDSGPSINSIEVLDREYINKTKAAKSSNKMVSLDLSHVDLDDPKKSKPIKADRSPNNSVCKSSKSKKSMKSVKSNIFRKESIAQKLEEPKSIKSLKVIDGGGLKGNLKRNMAKVKTAVKLMTMGVQKKEENKINLTRRLFKNFYKMDKGSLLGKYYMFLAKKKETLNLLDRLFLCVSQNH